MTKQKKKVNKSCDNCFYGNPCLNQTSEQKSIKECWKPKEKQGIVVEITHYTQFNRIALLPCPELYSIIPKGSTRKFRLIPVEVK